MAKVKDPLHSVEARGKIAGLIYNTGRGGKYVKGFTSPVQRRTALQLVKRALLVTTAHLWSIITGPQRILWNAYATEHPVQDWTGNSILLSGFNWFCRCNIVKTWLTGLYSATPPSVSSPDAPVALVATGGVGTISVAFTAALGTGTSIILWLEGPMSVGRVPKRERAKFNIFGPGETTPLVISGLSAGFYAVFAQMALEANGLTSPWALATATVT